MYYLLIFLSLAELILFILLLAFFRRLKHSEQLLTKLQNGQQTLMDKLQANAELEREITQTFAVRQQELQLLNQLLQQRSDELQKLVEQAEAISRSPQFLRELIINGTKKGRSPLQLAKATGLSLDEIELILSESQR